MNRFNPGCCGCGGDGGHDCGECMLPAADLAYSIDFPFNATFPQFCHCPGHSGTLTYVPKPLRHAFSTDTLNAAPFHWIAGPFCQATDSVAFPGSYEVVQYWIILYCADGVLTGGISTSSVLDDVDPGDGCASPCGFPEEDPGNAYTTYYQDDTYGYFALRTGNTVGAVTVNNCDPLDVEQSDAFIVFTYAYDLAITP